MQGHQRHSRALIVVIGVGDQRGVVKKFRQGDALFFRLHCRVHKFLQVLNAVLRFRLILFAQNLDVTGTIKNALEELPHQQGFMIGHQLLHQGMERFESLERAPRQTAGGNLGFQSFPQTELFCARGGFNRAHGRRANSPRRSVDDALERCPVFGIDREPRVSQYVANFRASVKTESAHQPVSDPVAAQRLFQQARLGIGTVQHSHAGVCIPRESFCHFVPNVERFLVRVPRFKQANRIAAFAIRP